MKKIVSIIIIFIIVSVVGYFTAFSKNDDILNASLNKAKREDKGLLIYFYSRYCTYCELMEKDVLLNNEIRDMLKKDVVFLKVDGDVMKDVAKKYNVRGYPTVWLVEPNGKKISNVPGYVSRRDFKKMILYLKGKHYKIMSFIDFMGQI